MAIAKLMSEAQLDDAILDIAVRQNPRPWLTYHTRRSDGSEPGFPDRVFVRDGRMIIAELKKEDGKMSPAQHVWARELNKLEANAGGAFHVYLWRPSDLNNGTIAAALR